MIDSFQGHISNNPFRENKTNIKTEGGGIAYEMMNCRCGGEDSKRLRCWGWQGLSAGHKAHVRPWRISVPSSAGSWSMAQLRCWWHSDGSRPPPLRAHQDITTGSGPNTGEQRKPHCLMLVQLNRENMKHYYAMPNSKEVVLIYLISSRIDCFCEEKIKQIAYW